MTGDKARVQALVEEAAGWAINQDELHMKIKPIAEHFTQVASLEGLTSAMFAEVMIAVAKALEAGIYFGRFGFPEDRIPDAFKDAFEDNHGGGSL
jgi:hypothetical protein